MLVQALPLITIIVGDKTEDGVCRLATTAEGVGDLRYIEFPAPTKHNPLKPGLPAWANYVKGVMACYPIQGVVLNSLKSLIA